MTTHLTPGQRAMLEATLRLRQGELDRRLAAQQGDKSRTEHAREILLQDGDDAPQRDSDREVDLALNDLELQELGAVSQALRRVHEDAFGQCSACGVEIPFDRLKIEPHATRCVSCESAREARGARSH